MTFATHQTHTRSSCHTTDTHLPIHTASKGPLTGEQLKVEFSKETGQTALVRSRALPDKRCNQPTLYTDEPFYSLLLHLLLPKSPKAFLCPAFGSSPKHPIIDPSQSSEALALHPLMCPTPQPSNPPLVQEATWRAAPHGSWWWVSAWMLWLRLCGKSPGRGLDKVSFPLSLSFGFLPAFVPPVLLCAYEDGCFMALLCWIWE